MKPFAAAQLLGVAALILTLDGLITFFTGRFRLGRHGTILTLTGPSAYVAAAASLAVAAICIAFCVKKTRQGFREKPYRIDYP
jgi:hypothetical protein